MDTISKIVFWVAKSLLIPDVIVLLALFGRALLLVGSFYNQLITKFKNDKTFEDVIKKLTPNTIPELKKLLPEKNNSLYVKYMRDLLNHEPSVAYSDFLISNFENEAEKDISTSKLLAKIGPVLGLIGTLIAMSPALTGLSSGDISGMAYNMQVVFATTVVGLVVSLIGLVTLQFKQRWYAKETNNLDYIAQILTQNIGK